MKIWAKCEAGSSYAYWMQVYTGKNATVKRKVNQGVRVVKESQNSDRNIICDNFFTSVPLGCKIMEKKLPLVGTIRKNKP